MKLQDPGDPVDPPLDPVDSAAINVLLPPEGKGFTTHNREPGGKDQYGLASTISAIERLGAEWAQRYPDVRLAIGDISRKGGGRFPPHASHSKGREVDIRPLTKSGINQPTTIQDQNYSHERTKELVLMIKRLFPNAVIIFNDPRMVAEGLTRRLTGMDNHLHIMLPK